jgi:hypothetical protein
MYCIFRPKTHHWLPKRKQWPQFAGLSACCPISRLINVSHFRGLLVTQQPLAYRSLNASFALLQAETGVTEYVISRFPGVLPRRLKIPGSCAESLFWSEDAQQPWVWLLLAASIIALMMEAASSSETPVSFCQTTRRNVLEDDYLHTGRRENLKSQTDWTTVSWIYYSHDNTVHS